MKRNTLLFAILFIAAAVLTTSCKRKVEQVEEAPQKVVSLDLSDSTAFHELVHFYITNDIIPKEAVLCDHEKNGGIHTFACLAEDLELCAPDYLQDSLHGTFFQEVVYNPGSSGDNNIYICQKDEKGFHLLKSFVGTTDPDLGPQDEFVNGYKVIYFQTEDAAYKLYYDGKDFVTEPVATPSLAIK